VRTVVQLNDQLTHIATPTSATCARSLSVQEGTLYE
jgi:hypothetical protein